MATKYKPILFSTEMVQAILEGRKTQTRRICKVKIEENNQDNTFNFFSKKHAAINVSKEDLNTSFAGILDLAPYQNGDILWVRETWQTTYNESTNNWDSIYKADGGYWIDDDGIMKWKPSIYMPKKRARIFLEVTNVRVEPLQEISEEDAIAEGIERVSIAPFVHRFKNYLCNNKFIGPKESFKTLWMKINGIESWQSNPWVWVYDFKVVEKPKDFTHEH